MNDLDDDQTALVDALDRWFEILREELKATVPLKPATRVELDQFANVLEVDLPADVVTLFEYTNGAWLEDGTPLWEAFLPSGLEFAGIPSTPTAWKHLPIEGSFSRMFALNHSEGESWSGFAYDQFNDIDWVQDVPLFTGHTDFAQLSIQAGERCHHACAVFFVDGMMWVARRLSDVFENAINLYERDYLVWVNRSVVGFREHYPGMRVGVPWDLDRCLDAEGKFTYPGWVWEELPPL